MFKSRIVVPLAVTALALSACAGGENEGDGESTTDTTASETTDAGNDESADGAEESTDDAESGDAAAEGTVTLVTHDSFYLPEELLEAFSEESGYTVETVAPGDAGALVNQLILTKDSPLGDAVFGIDNTFASRAVDEGVLAAAEVEGVPEGFDTFDGMLTPIDQGDVCLNIDLGWFEENGVAEPATFEDLLKPEYADLTVVTNPATSSPGLAFMLATIAEFGEDGWQQYWTDLLANGTRVADSWSDAYYVDFSGSEGEGDYPIVLSYSSSPSAEIGDDGEPTTGNVDATCFRAVEYAGVLEGAANPEGAQALVEFLLTPEVQAALPESMYMYPVVEGIELPEAWAEVATLSEEPLTLDPAQISEQRDAWLEEWLALVG